MPFFRSYSDTVEILDDDCGAIESGKSSEDDNPWRIYTSWNQFKQPTEYTFVGIKLKPAPVKDDVDPMQDLRLVGRLNTILRFLFIGY